MSHEKHQPQDDATRPPRHSTARLLLMVILYSVIGTVIAIIAFVTLMGLTCGGLTVGR